MGEQTRQEVVAGVNLAEMRAFNTSIITDVIRGLTLAELQGSNPALVDQITNSAKVTEMKLTVGGQERVVKLDGVQDVVKEVETKVTELQGQIAQSKLDTFKATKIAEMVDEQYREKVAPRVTGNTEQAITDSITAEVAFIKEIAGTTGSNKPRGNKPRIDGGDNMAEQVKNLFGVKEKK